MHLLAALSWVFMCFDSPSTQSVRPVPILAAIEARERLVTGEVQWSWTRKHQKNAPAATEQFYTSRFAGDSYVVVARGDSQGVLYRDDHGAPRTLYSFHGNPEHYLVRDSVAWMRYERAPFASIERSDQPRHYIWDIRCIGLLAVVPRNAMSARGAIDRMGLAEVPSVTWKQSKVNGGILITARYSERRVSWLLDSVRGFNPIRASVADTESGKVLAESRTVLKQFDGIWFPEVVEYRTVGEQSENMIRVFSANFNTKSQPKELMPEDIGVEAGASLHIASDIRARMGLPSAAREYCWDGKAIVSSDEMWARVKKGEVKLGMHYLDDVARLKEGRPTLLIAERGLVTANQPSGSRTANIRCPPIHEWDRYVDEIAGRYGFNDVQKEAAQAILRDIKSKVSKNETDLAPFFEQLRQRVPSLFDADQRRKYERDETKARL